MSRRGRFQQISVKIFHFRSQGDLCRSSVIERDGLQLPGQVPRNRCGRHSSPDGERAGAGRFQGGGWHALKAWRKCVGRVRSPRPSKTQSVPPRSQDDLGGYGGRLMLPAALREPSYPQPSAGLRRKREWLRDRPGIRLRRRGRPACRACHRPGRERCAGR